MLFRSLDPTPVEWDAVFEAWMVHKASKDMRKAWIQQSSGKLVQEHEEDAEEKEPQPEHDEVIERVKRDPELDQHEQRLLGCIVDTGGYLVVKGYILPLTSFFPCNSINNHYI